MVDLYLKVALRDYNDMDIQYIEVTDDITDATEIHASSLTAEEAWAVKTPTAECIQLVQAQVPGSKVRVFRHVPYLMSPKALLHFPTQDMYRDVLLLTFCMPGTTDHYFLMVHMKNRHFWHLPWCSRGELRVPAFLERALNVPLGLKQCRHVGHWKVFKQHHKVIDVKTFIHFRLFHRHLNFEEVEALFAHFQVQGAFASPGTQTFHLPDNEHFHSLMVVPCSGLLELPAVVEDVNVDQWHTDAVHVCLGTGKKLYRHLNVHKIIL